MRDRIIPLLLAAALLGPTAAHASAPFVPLAPGAAAAFCADCVPTRPPAASAFTPAFSPASLLTQTPGTSYSPLAPGRRVGATHGPDLFPARPRSLS